MVVHPVGVVLERRRSERRNNHEDPLRLAQRTYAFDAEDGVNIVIDASQVCAPFPPERPGDRSAG